MDTVDTDRQGSPGGHDGGQKDRGPGADQDHVAGYLEQQVRDEEDGQDDRVFRGCVSATIPIMNIKVQTTHKTSSSPSPYHPSWPVCQPHPAYTQAVYTYISNIRPIDVIHDIHDPEHRQEVLVDLANESLLLWRVGDIGGNSFIFERVALAIDRVDVVGVLLVVNGLHDDW